MKVSKMYVNAIFNGRQGIGKKQAEKMENLFGLSSVWLLTGEGSMLTGEQQKAEKGEYVDVPILNLDARGGFLANDVTGQPEYAVGCHPISRKIARDGDIIVPVYGDSMYPKYTSGSLILIRHIEQWKEYLEMGAPYVIELQDGQRLIKYIRKGSSNDKLMLHSENQKYEDTEINKTFVRNVFRVIMIVQRDVM